MKRAHGWHRHKQHKGRLVAGGEGSLWRGGVSPGRGLLSAFILPHPPKKTSQSRNDRQVALAGVPRGAVACSALPPPPHEVPFCLPRNELSEHLETIDSSLDHLQTMLTTHSFSVDTSALLDVRPPLGALGRGWASWRGDPPP